MIKPERRCCARLALPRRTPRFPLLGSADCLCPAFAASQTSCFKIRSSVVSTITRTLRPLCGRFPAGWRAAAGVGREYLRMTGSPNCTYACSMLYRDQKSRDIVSKNRSQKNRTLVIVLALLAFAVSLPHFASKNRRRKRKKTEAHQCIEQFLAQYGTDVRENRGNLSGRQLQRIWTAKAEHLRNGPSRRGSCVNAMTTSSADKRPLSLSAQIFWYTLSRNRGS